MTPIKDENGRVIKFVGVQVRDGGAGSPGGGGGCSAQPLALCTSQLPRLPSPSARLEDARPPRPPTHPLTQVDVTNRTEGRAYTDASGVPVLVHYDDR